MVKAVTPVSHKEAAVRFLQLVVANHIDEAYDRYVDMKGKHHNVYFAAGFPALKQAMIDDHAKHPPKQLTVKHVLGDGDLVAVHSRLQRDKTETSIAVVHLFRFEGRKIAEMWDLGMEVPGNSPNKDGAF
jgi:predicted SnoaL-like aldol condensation-catalyzing enzyme